MGVEHLNIHVRYGGNGRLRRAGFRGVGLPTGGFHFRVLYYSLLQRFFIGGSRW
jgi:hypothetical protein